MIVRGCFGSYGREIVWERVTVNMVAVHEPINLGLLRHLYINVGLFGKAALLRWVFMLEDMLWSAHAASVKEQRPAMGSYVS